MSTILTFPEDIDPENIFFQWPDRAKNWHIYQRIFKEGNGDHKYLWCPDVGDNNFDVLRTSIALNT